MPATVSTQKTYLFTLELTQSLLQQLSMKTVLALCFCDVCNFKNNEKNKLWETSDKFSSGMSSKATLNYLDV